MSQQVKADILVYTVSKTEVQGNRDIQVERLISGCNGRVWFGFSFKCYRLVNYTSSRH